jgi:hypothetical protein
LNPATNNPNQELSTCEELHEDLMEDEKEKKAGKSNSELMAEFFAIASDEDKKE